MSYPFNDYRKRPRGKWLFFPFIAAVLALALGGIVMLLWNALLPQLVHVSAISYWQAVGLLVLCRILFGNFGRGGGPGRHGRNYMGGPGNAMRDNMREKWKEMTPEERARFKSEWRERCHRRNDNKQ